MSNTDQSYEIFAFRAVDEPELCSDYVKGHVKVLTDYGITNITSNNPTWFNNANIYCLGLRNSESQELLGGIRIQIADGIYPLPVEEAIGYLDSKIYSKVKDYATHGGVGELSGLWVNNKIKGLGMGTCLVRASISSSNQLLFKTMIGICAGYSLKMFNEVGFIIDKYLGDEGNFRYPNEKYLAHVVGILNATTLGSAIDHDKKIMLALRNNIVQERCENVTGVDVNVSYNLKYPNVEKAKYIV